MRLSHLFQHVRCRLNAIVASVFAGIAEVAEKPYDVFLNLSFVKEAVRLLMVAYVRNPKRFLQVGPYPVSHGVEANGNFPVRGENVLIQQVFVVLGLPAVLVHARL
jgi:hypothetical protein